MLRVSVELTPVSIQAMRLVALTWPDVALSISVEPFESDDGRRLVAALDAGLAELYAPEQRFGPNLKAEHLEPGKGDFLVARVDGAAVGCGAFRLLDPQTAEVKRMYVEPGHRGQGVGRAVLAQLEQMAATAGARRLVLETGVHQAEAIALYRSAGYVPVECWGEYAAAVTSRCFEKRLEAARGLSARRRSPRRRLPPPGPTRSRGSRA